MEAFNDAVMGDCLKTHFRHLHLSPLSADRSGSREATLAEYSQKLRVSGKVKEVLSVWM